MALAIDVTASGTGRKSNGQTVTTTAFSTAGANELLIALVSYAGGANVGGSTATVSGASLAWTLVKRQNTRAGTSEIWRAWAAGTLTSVTVTATVTGAGGDSFGSAVISVLAFTGTDATSGDGSSAIGATNGASAASGAPTCSLTTTRDGSWVLGAGDDWDNNVGRTIGSGQTLIQQFVNATDGDTSWTQQRTTTTATIGTVVTINDTAPTADQYNLAIVEVLASAAAGPTVDQLAACWAQQDQPARERNEVVSY